MARGYLSEFYYYSHTPITMIILLLCLIASLELLRVGLPYWPVSKKSHFKQKRGGVEKMIWDLEFKIFKTREIREDVRKEYDQAKSRLSILQEQIDNWPPDKDEGDKKVLEDKLVLLKRDIERFEAQLKSLDLEVEGSVPTKDYPDGVQGIKHQIDSLRELKLMLRDWIKDL